MPRRAADSPAPRRRPRPRPALDLGVLADHLPAMIAYVDGQRRYRFVNRRYGEWFGMPAAAIVGRSVRDLLGEDTYGEICQHVDEALAGRSVAYELTREFPGRGARHLLVRYVPDLGENGLARGFFTLITDITERKAAELELRWNEERSRNLVHAILDAAIDGLITIDERGTIQSVNLAAQRMFGYTAAELTGRNVNELMPAPYAAEHDGYLARYLATGERRVIGIGREVAGRRKDGTTFPLEIAVGEVHWDGRILFAGFLRDLSERKRLESDLLQAQKMEALGRLAGGIAHFNNLLMGIIGCCQVAAGQLADTHPARALLDDVSREAERGTGLTRQLLTFSRKRQLAPKRIDLNDVVGPAQTIIRRLLGEDVALHVVLAPGGAPIVADPAQIEQILMNLVVNARDAMPDGGELHVETRGADADADASDGRARGAAGHHVQLVVRDTGVGMDRDTQAHIFEPFFTTKGPGEGTGLGLSTVYGIVTQLGGRVDVASEPGRGATFTVLIPHAGEPATPAPATATALPSGGSETILLVEDEGLIRASLRHLLGQLGYRVLAARDAAEALRLCGDGAQPIDVILTDVVLPGRSGPELVAEIHARRPGAAALYMSAYPADDLVRQGRLPAGASSLEAPLTAEALSAKIREVLDRPR